MDGRPALGLARARPNLQTAVHAQSSPVNLIERSYAYDLHPIRCQYGAHLHGAELAMASVNCGAPIVTRAQAENLLDEYFALVEQAIPSTEDNPLDRRS